MSYVYALVDPRDNSWFYIGKGSNYRKNHHFQPSRLEQSYNPHKKHKIESIREGGQSPRSEILIDGLDEELAYFVEKELVEKHFDSLTNIEEGGEGFPEGVVKTESHREKLSLAMRGKTAKLSEREAREIKYLAQSGYRHVDIAKEYDIAPKTVSHIKHRNAWSYVAPLEPNSIPSSISRGQLLEKEAAEIKWLAQRGYNQRQIAQTYPASKQCVSSIVNERRWDHIEAKKPDSIPDHLEKGSTQLSVKQAAEIKWLAENGYRRADVAESYDISASYIYNIKTGKQWDGLTPKRPSTIPDSFRKTRLSTREVGEIKWLLNNTDHTQNKIGDMYEMTASLISAINTGRKYPDVEPSKP